MRIASLDNQSADAQATRQNFCMFSGDISLAEIKAALKSMLK